MRGDVVAGRAPGVARHAGERGAQRGEGRAQAVDPRHLTGADPNQRHEVVAVPAPLGVRLSDSQAAAEHGPPEARVAHLDAGPQLGAGRAERAYASALLDFDPPLGQPAEGGAHELAGDHLAGCGWYGAPLSLSRTACQ